MDHQADIKREEWATVFAQLEPGFTQIDHGERMITVGKHPSLGSVVAIDSCLERLITISSSDFPAWVLFEADEDDLIGTKRSPPHLRLLDLTATAENEHFR